MKYPNSYTNKIICGDCLEVMKDIPDNVIDLIYCDILYGTGKNFGDYQDLKADKKIIDDFYISRIKEMHRVLKETGSIYIQMDWRINHWVRLILDEIFGYDNFRNEIIWCYRGAGYSKKDFGKRHDTIFRYSKTDDYIFNLDDMREEYAEATKERFSHYIGNIRKGKNFGVQKLHPLGKQPDDWWQIQPVAPSAKERIGYPTQKPEILLERIIKASSNKGDLVLDAFCGCGTTLVVAKKLNRYYMGCDISRSACEIARRRLSTIPELLF